jgi:hypothetical protein
MKKGAGRPAKPLNESRRPGLSVRLTTSEMERIEHAAALSRLRKSDWARKCLLYVIERDIRIT